MTPHPRVPLGYKGQAITATALPALPSVLHEALHLIAHSRPSTPQLAAIISRDQGLSAKVLKIINSPVYGFTGRITTIPNALALLGFNVIHTVIVTSVVGDILNQTMRDLWAHSYACSLACGCIARTLALANTSEFVLAGLLHDFGKAVIGIQLPEALQEIAQLVDTEDLTFYAAEKRVLGFTHLDVNAWIAAEWALPPAIGDAMAHHHAPVAKGQRTPLICVTHLGDFFARIFEQGSGGDNNVPRLDLATLRHLNITQDTLGDIMDSLGETFASDAGRL